MNAFRTHGILLHQTTCHGWVCNQQEANRWLDSTLASRSLPPEIETDCGKWCSATSFQHASLPFIPYSWTGVKSGIALVYEANEEVWDHVQCTSVTDSSTTTRTCCACGDPNLCPFKNFERYDSGVYRRAPTVST